MTEASVAVDPPQDSHGESVQIATEDEELDDSALEECTAMVDQELMLQTVLITMNMVGILVVRAKMKKWIYQLQNDDTQPQPFPVGLILPLLTDIRWSTAEYKEWPLQGFLRRVQIGTQISYSLRSTLNARGEDLEHWHMQRRS
ncbi:hypothetical protein BJ878DRAFT_483268 [Calycina marina]|uniref:Uncharacterized protein n=1 Tax=Calycina marina TaxID=1763456 RepID=A0A9P7YXB2_9HELO|nr:hypothetical protein BJ878DRAFT_483268 [Calycina marina]